MREEPREEKEDPWNYTVLPGYTRLLALSMQVVFPAPYVFGGPSASPSSVAPLVCTVHANSLIEVSSEAWSEGVQGGVRRHMYATLTTASYSHPDSATTTGASSVVSASASTPAPSTSLTRRAASLLRSLGILQHTGPSAGAAPTAGLLLSSLGPHSADSGSSSSSTSSVQERLCGLEAGMQAGAMASQGSTHHATLCLVTRLTLFVPPSRWDDGGGPVTALAQAAPTTSSHHHDAAHDSATTAAHVQLLASPGPDAAGNARAAGSTLTSSSTVSGVHFRALPAYELGAVLRGAAAAAPSLTPFDDGALALSAGGSGGGGVAGEVALDSEAVRLLVQSTVEGVLGQAVEPEAPLMAAGLDSLGATEVRNGLQVRGVRGLVVTQGVCVCGCGGVCCRLQVRGVCWGGWRSSS